MGIARMPLPSGVHALAALPGSASARLRDGLERDPVVWAVDGWGELCVPYGAAAWTLGRHVVVRRYELAAPTATLLLAHECVHVAQWGESGRIGFLRTYVADYLRARRSGGGHWAAYRRIPAEIEAYAVEAALADAAEAADVADDGDAPAS